MLKKIYFPAESILKCKEYLRCNHGKYIWLNCYLFYSPSCDDILKSMQKVHTLQKRVKCAITENYFVVKLTSGSKTRIT